MGCANYLGVNHVQITEVCTNWTMNPTLVAKLHFGTSVCRTEAVRLQVCYCSSFPNLYGGVFEGANPFLKFPTTEAFLHRRSQTIRAKTSSSWGFP